MFGTDNCCYLYLSIHRYCNLLVVLQIKFSLNTFSLSKYNNFVDNDDTQDVVTLYYNTDCLTCTNMNQLQLYVISDQEWDSKLSCSMYATSQHTLTILQNVHIIDEWRKLRKKSTTNYKQLKIVMAAEQQ